MARFFASRLSVLILRVLMPRERTNTDGTTRTSCPSSHARIAIRRLSAHDSMATRLLEEVLDLGSTEGPFEQHGTLAAHPANRASTRSQIDANSSWFRAAPTALVFEVYDTTSSER